MADEDPWGAADEEETPVVASKPASKAASKAGSKAGSKTGSKAGTPKGTGAVNTPSRAATPTSNAGDAPADGELPEAEVPPQDDPNRPRPLKLYKHWVR